MLIVYQSLFQVNRFCLTINALRFTVYQRLNITGKTYLLHAQPAVKHLIIEYCRILCYNSFG